ncbi:MAG TPA: PAS domain S-box protein [Pyrinomonadaceae bacterium]|nr:PAS domain S-box protein [Pyrinomonadaceae bacterium]
MQDPGQDQNNPSRRLAAINRAITTSLNFDEVLDLIVDNACELVHAKICLVLLLNQEERLTIQAARGVEANVVKDFAGRMEEDVLGHLQHSLPLNPAEKLVSFPIIGHQVLSGLLVVSREQEITREERWQLSALADQAAIALRNAQLYEVQLAEAANARAASELESRRLAAIVESSDDAIVSKNLHGIIRSWNKGAERVFGYSAEEVVGKPIHILIPEDRHAEEELILERIRSGQRVEHFETIRVCKDGRHINVSLTISPIKNDRGEIIGASKIARDITDSKEAEERLRRALEFDETVMLSMGEGLFTLDNEGRVTFMNPAAQRLFGWTLTEMLGRKMHDVTHHSRPDGSPFPIEECAGYAVLREGKMLSEHEDVFIRKDGSFFDVVYSSSPLRGDGKVTGVVVVFRDISDRKHAEEERARLLQAEREARADAERANQLKDEFLATLSHELRNPLNVVIGYAEILRRSDNQKPDFVVKAAETIRRNALAQSQLVSDLLDLSRLQMGKLSLNKKPSSLSTIIRDAVETVRDEALAKPVSLSIELDPEVLVVEGDPVRLGQIAWNLFNNAIKFTPAGGQVSIRLGKEDGHAVIIVEDNGQGIVPEFLPHVFEIFRQADASIIRKQGGMGIGLALVKQLAELHEGSVTAESEGVGKGARFTVRLPLYQAGASALSHGTRGVTGALKAKFILVVDDSPETTEMLGKLLELEGAFVESARSGKEALEIARRKNFDLVISDISMPEMDGYELLQRLRTLPGMTNIPAVALTGYGRSNDVERALNEGFAEHLTKPLDLDELLLIVRRLTGETVLR